VENKIPPLCKEFIFLNFEGFIFQWKMFFIQPNNIKQHVSPLQENMKNVLHPNNIKQHVSPLQENMKNVLHPTKHPYRKGKIASQLLGIACRFFAVEFVTILV